MSAQAAHQWLTLRFPSQLLPEQFEDFLRALHGVSSPHGRDAFVLQAVGQRGHVEYALRVPQARRTAVVRQAASTMPGLVLTPSDVAPLGTPQAAWRLWMSTSRRPLRTSNPIGVSRAILTALAAARGEQVVALQWLLGPVRRPIVVPNKHAPLLSESWATALVTAPLFGPDDVDSEARRALRDKQGEPGWRAVGRIAVQAATRDQGKALLGGLLGALRTAEDAGTAFGVHPVQPKTLSLAHLPWRWGLALSVSEVTALAGWPLGDTPSAPVDQRRSRLLPAPDHVPRRGRVLAVSPTTERPLAISPTDSLHHLWAVGPTGTGKSTLLLNLITQDMAAGRSIVVIEPKGDLISDVLARVPAGRENDVVLLEPTAVSPVGFNPLAGKAPADLVADQLLTVFARLNSNSWGPRLAEVLHAGLLTLARTPGMSLAALPPLLTNDDFRRRIVGALDDPLGVSPIWAAFERLSEDARAQVVAAVLNKVRVLTARPALRAVLGQTSPRFSLDKVFSSERPILLANLAKGTVGPDSARLLGTLLLNQLWQTALARTSIAAERRHLVAVYVDELQDYAGLPADLGDMLAQARGLGVAFSLANQHLAQLAPDLRNGVLANARNRVVFQVSGGDARVLARDHSELKATDFTQLEAHEVYLRLSSSAAVTPYISGRTLPPPEVTSDPAVIRRLSSERYGVDRTETDAALRTLVEGPTRPIGRTRRPS